MKHTPTIVIVLLGAATVASCISRPTVPDLPADAVLTRPAVQKMFPPILASRRDILTVGTQAQIEDHNNRVWCEFPETRPADFDVAICPQ